MTTKVRDLKEGDLVDLDNDPYFAQHPMTEFEYAEVVEVTPETPNCTLVAYEGVGAAGYDPNHEMVLQGK